MQLLVPTATTSIFPKSPFKSQQPAFLLLSQPFLFKLYFFTYVRYLRLNIRPGTPGKHFPTRRHPGPPPRCQVHSSAASSRASVRPAPAYLLTSNRTHFLSLCFNVNIKDCTVTSLENPMSSSFSSHPAVSRPSAGEEHSRLSYFEPPETAPPPHSLRS